VSRPDFIVPLADLERGPRKVRWTISEAWLRDALVGTDAVPRGGDGELGVELMKNGREVMVRGSARVALTMPSARSLEPVPLDLEPEIFLLLAPAQPEVVPGRARKKRRGQADGGRLRDAHPAREGAGRSRGPWEDPPLTQDQAARDTFSGDQIVLDSFLREFILLDLPMSPLRNDEAEGDTGLRSGQEPAIRPPSTAGEEAPIDPRLRPLAAIASRLRGKE
jgi:uncharacterized protein